MARKFLDFYIVYFKPEARAQAQAHHLTCGAFGTTTQCHHPTRANTKTCVVFVPLCGSGVMCMCMSFACDFSADLRQQSSMKTTRLQAKDFAKMTKVESPQLHAATQYDCLGHNVPPVQPDQVQRHHPVPPTYLLLCRLASEIAYEDYKKKLSSQGLYQYDQGGAPTAAQRAKEAQAAQGQAERAVRHQAAPTS